MSIRMVHMNNLYGIFPKKIHFFCWRGRIRTTAWDLFWFMAGSWFINKQMYNFPGILIALLFNTVGIGFNTKQPARRSSNEHQATTSNQHPAATKKTNQQQRATEEATMCVRRSKKTKKKEEAKEQQEEEEEDRAEEEEDEAEVKRRRGERERMSHCSLCIKWLKGNLVILLKVLGVPAKMLGAQSNTQIASLKLIESIEPKAYFILLS